MIKEIMRNVKEKNPLVHCITNYVTVNDCANIILASGASPIMADDASEVEDIVSISSALVLNIGTLNERTVNSMLIAGKKANELNIPVIFDPVGAGASKFRTEVTRKIMNEIDLALITGNISEIKTIVKGSGKTKGVDASKEDEIKEENIDIIIDMAKKLSKDTNAIISITGEIDVIANENDAYIVRNGHKIMPMITGTGCMLTSIIGGYIAANPGNILKATTVATALMGLSGERAFKKIEKNNEGTSSFRNYLIDNIYLINEEDIGKDGKIESK